MKIKKLLKPYIKQSYGYIIYKLISLKIGEITNKQTRRSEIFKFYKQFLKAGDLCFDIGANIGNKSAIFKQLGCRVIAVEPQNYCVKFLKVRFGKGITIVPKAISDKIGTAEINISDSDTISTLSTEWIANVKVTRFPTHTWERKEVVQLTTLDNLINEFGLPMYCKIDVEGYEYKVLKSLTKKIKYISFEFAFPESLNSTINIFAHLMELGDFVCNYTESESMVFKYKEWMPAEKFLNIIISSKNDLTDWGDIYIKFN